VFDALRQSIARWIAPVKSSAPASYGRRMYAVGRPGRTTSGWGTSTTSEDSELQTSLRTARNRSRALIRDAAYAKRAKVIVQNNVVGSGIGLQAKVKTTRNSFHDAINDDIETAWERWSLATSCHMGRSLHFCDLERLLIGQVFETGEIFVRTHFRALPGSAVPLALEVIEPERLADEFSPSPGDPANTVRLGVEVDPYGAPVAYFIRTSHPGDYGLNPLATDRVERVPAEQILHLRIIDRWPQTRAIPWMHAAARKLNDMDGLTEAEITAARASACYMGFVQPPADNESSFGDEQPDGSVQEELEPAVIHKLNPGETFESFAPNRPNTQLDPFMRMMLREVAAGVGCSYESLSRDYSQSNYSSSRLALLDDRDLWRVLQLWFIRTFRYELHRVWLQQAVLAGAVPSIRIAEYAVNQKKFEAVRFKPRGWNWVDPTKEVAAYKEAVRCGFTTVSDVIAQTGNGRDIEEILDEREQELDAMEEKGLVFDTDPSVAANGQPTAPEVPPTKETKDDDAPEDASVQAAEKMLQQVGRSHV
jgi:lambda family phage portal protein